MKFSIIIPYYNGDKYIDKCLNSIAKRSLYRNYEIIIIDDASPVPIARKIKRKFKKVKFFRNKQNVGFVRTVNKGAKRATGDIYIFLNMDTEIISSGWLYALKHMFEQSEKNGIIGGKLLFPDSGLIQFAGGIINPYEKRPEHLYYQAPSYLPGVNRGRLVDYITGAFFSIPQKLFLSLGGFSEEYQSANEDVDLSLRVKQKGYHIVYNPYISIYHYETVTGLSDVYAFASNRIFHKRWSLYLSKHRKKYYEEDGYSEEFIRTMIRIFYQDFYNIVKFVDEFKLNSPERQNAFLEKKNINTLLEFLIYHFSNKDTQFLYDLYYYQFRNEIQKENNRNGCIQSAIRLLNTDEHNKRSDEVRIFLKLVEMKKYSYSRSDFKNEMYYQVHTIIEKIENGIYRFNFHNSIYEKRLLGKLLEMITCASCVIVSQRLRIFVSFIMEKENLFENKDTLISLLFRLANRNYNGNGDYYCKKAEEIIDNYDWPPPYMVKFALNNGSYYEKKYDYERAYIYYKKALRYINYIDCYMLASLYYHLGFCDMYRRKKDSAKHLFKKCLDVMPEHKKAREYLVQLCRK